METSGLTDARKTSAEEEHFSRFISIFVPRNSFRPFSLYPAIPAATTVMGNLGRTIFFFENIFPIFHVVFAMDRSLLFFFLLKPSPPQSLM